jgi:hypothetical protein
MREEIRGYQLLLEDDLDCFNEIVNHHLEDGYQIMEGQQARIEEVNGMVTYRIEMVRYVQNARMADFEEAVTTARGGTRLNTLAREARPIPEREVEEDIFDEEVEVPPQPAGTFWTADSPDPFDGDVDDAAEEAGEINDHQLNRLGALRESFDNEVSDVMEVPRAIPETLRTAVERAVEMDAMATAGVATNRPNRALRGAVQEMREAQMERAETNVAQMDGGMAEMNQVEANDSPF